MRNFYGKAFAKSRLRFASGISSSGPDSPLYPLRKLSKNESEEAHSEVNLILAPDSEDFGFAEEDKYAAHVKPDYERLMLHFRCVRKFGVLKI